MVEASITEASGSVLSQKRQLPSDGTNRHGKRRLAIEMDLDILDCPICCESLRIPIFQCENGHLACSSCCPKLRNKCPACGCTNGHIRCRAMESVLESIFVPCRNTEFGCTKNVSYEKKLTHEKECIFSQCSCPVQGCEYSGSYMDLYGHYYCIHVNNCMLEMFVSFTSYNIRMKISDKMMIRMECQRILLFVVQCFREPYGVYVTVSCIAPSSPQVVKFSYDLSYTVDGHTVIYKLPEVKRILQVSFETPQESSMLIPNSLLRGEELEMKLRLKESNQ